VSEIAVPSTPISPWLLSRHAYEVPHGRSLHARFRSPSPHVAAASAVNPSRDDIAKRLLDSAITLLRGIFSSLVVPEA